MNLDYQFTHQKEFSRFCTVGLHIHLILLIAAMQTGEPCCKAMNKDLPYSLELRVPGDRGVVATECISRDFVP